MRKVISVLCLIAIIASSALMIVSCDSEPNSNPGEAEQALIAAGYTVVDGKASASKYGFVGLQTAIHAFKGFESVSIFYFDSEESAEVAYDLMVKTEEYYEAEYIKDGKEVPELNLKMDYVDNVVWIGTEAAIEAAE